MEIGDVIRDVERLEVSIAKVVDHADKLEERLRIAEAKLSMVSGFWAFVGFALGSIVTIISQIFGHPQGK